jgi:hypothetical protein
MLGWMTMSSIYHIVASWPLHSHCVPIKNKTCCWLNPTLWLFNSLLWYRWPIEIDGLPINNGDFQ